MPRTWNIDDVLRKQKTTFPYHANKLPTRKVPIPYEATQAQNVTCLVFLILSNDVFVQALPKFRPKITL